MNLNFGLPITFGVGIFLMFFLALNKLERCCYIVIFSSVFTGIAFLYINDNSILVYHICSMVLCLKFFNQMIGQKEKILVKGENINNMLFFLIYCFFSIFVVITKEAVEIPFVEAGSGFSHFSFQQFTQYIYLLHAFVMMYMVYRLLDNRTISMNKLWKCIDYMYLAVVVIGFAQLFIPNEIYNMVLKNDANGAVDQSVTFGTIKLVRIDSTFGEASFLGVFLVPLLCMYIYEAMRKITVKNALFIICGIAIEMLNQSSTFIIGMAGFIIGLLIVVLFKKVKSKQQGEKNKSDLRRNILILASAIVIAFLLKDVIKKDLNLFISKLSMQHFSGAVRFKCMSMALQAFMKNPILGIGFGTMRSMDLLSNWLAQLGIAGLLLYILPLCFLLIKLLVSGTQEGNKLFLLIAITNLIMFAAVPEFRYLFIWLYYAMAYYYLRPVKNEIYLHRAEVNDDRK